MKVRKGIIYAIVATILWAMVTPFIKYGLECGIPPLNFAGLRFTAAGVLLLAASWHRGGGWRTIRKNKSIFANLIIINIFLAYSVFYFGVDMVPAATSSIVMGVAPLVNILLAHFIARNDRLTWRKVACLLIGLTGILLIIGTGGVRGGAMGWQGLAGVGLLFANIILQGYSAICVSEHAERINPVFLNGVQMLFGGGLIYCTGLATEGFHPLTGLPWGFYLSFGSLVLISLCAFSLWFIALQSKDCRVSELNMSRMVSPVIGAVLSWVMIKGESPTLSTVGGMAIIMLSLLLYFRGKEETVPPRNT